MSSCLAKPPSTSISSGHPAVALADLLDHRPHLALVAADGITSTPTITWLVVSVANWTLYAGLNPPLAIFITVASGSVVEHRALSCSSAFFFASSSGSRFNAALIRSSRSRAAPLPGRCCRRPAAAGSSSDLVPQRLDLLRASANASSRVGAGGTRRPRPARTRIPSWATRSRSTSPSARRPATLLVSRSSSSAT